MQGLTSPGDPRWCRVRPGDLLIEPWDGGGCALFDRLSGETHVLSLIPADILQHLAGEPLDAPSLAKRIAHDYGAESSREVLEQVGRSLDQLRLLGLIEPIAP